MQSLTVLYDASCPFCVRCRAWMERQVALVRILFVDASSPEARAIVGHLARPASELVVVDEHGNAWLGHDAFIVCLWALSDYRWIADWATQPVSSSFARWAIAWVESHRRSLAGNCEAVGGQCGVPQDTKATA